MTLDEIKRDAEVAAATVQLNWDQLDDPKESAYFLQSLEKGVAMIPDLEHLYGKLTSGKSVLAPDEPTPLPYEDVEKYTQLIADELYAAYLIREVRDTFDQVNRIILLSGSTDA